MVAAHSARLIHGTGLPTSCFASNNVFNSRPPIDKSYSAYPYYNLFDYNSFGRLVLIEFNMHFGGGKKN